MGYRYSAEEILAGAVRVAEREGLSATSFRLVAAELGTSDRMVVYYFPDKAQLVRGVLGHLNDTLAGMLFDEAPPPTRADILTRAREVFTDPARGSIVTLFVEAVGLAGSGREPFASVMRELLSGWVTMLAGHLGSEREAVALVAALDGILLASAVLGTDAAAPGWDQLIEDAGIRSA